MRLVPSSLKSAQKAQRRAAFTLMEILVVVAIIVVLAGVASVSVFRYLDNAKVSSARSSCVTIAKAVKAYNLQTGGYPGSLKELLVPVDGGKPYIEEEAQLYDPWGKEYQMSGTDSDSEIEIFTMTPQGKRVSSIRANNQQ